MPHCTRAVSLLPTVLLLAAIAPLGCASHSDDEAEAPVAYEPVDVRACAAARTTLQPSLDLFGTLVPVPEQTAVISPQVNGALAAIAVVEGQKVDADQELMRLDSRLLDAEVVRLSAAVAEQAAALARLKRGPLPQEIEVARQDVAKYRANADAFKTKLAGLATLKEKGEISDVQFENARQALQAAEADCGAAAAKLALLEAGPRLEDIAEAEAKRAAADAALAAAKLQVQFCRIASPIRGIVTQLAARRGMAVDPASSLATVVDDSTLFVQFRVPSAFFDKVRPGASVQATVTSMPGEVFQGRVTRLAGQADPTTGNIDAFATLANDKALLRPGLGCRVRVLLPPIPDTIVIPVAAVADRDGTPVVTVAKDNKAREVEVKLGVRTEAEVQVLEGLAPGDLVVTENGYGLPDDCPVRIVQDSPPARSQER